MMGTDLIERVRRLDIKAGDILVVTLRRDISWLDRAKMNETAAFFAEAGIHCIVMREGDAEFTVVAREAD